MRPLLTSALVVLLLTSLHMHRAEAQATRPLFDYVNVGVGLNIYQGDLDANPDHDPIKYLSSGNLNGLIGVERRYGNAGLGAQLTFNRFSVERGVVDMANNILSLDVLGSYGVDLFRPDFFRFFAGAGPALTVPTYFRFPDEEALNERQREIYEETSASVVGTFTAGVVIQQRIRLGVKLAFTDLLDGVANGGDRDYLTYVNMGWRFNWPE